jgi:hypothetical protein
MKALNDWAQPFLCLILALNYIHLLFLLGILGARFLCKGDALVEFASNVKPSD